MSDGQIGEDEISSLGWSVEVSHARGRHASQDGGIVGGAILDTAVSNGAGLLKTGIEEEVGVVVKGDVLALLDGRTLNDTKLDNRRRVNRSSVAVRYWGVSKGLGLQRAIDGSLGSVERPTHLSCPNHMHELALAAAELSTGTRGGGSLSSRDGCAGTGPASWTRPQRKVSP